MIKKELAIGMIITLALAVSGTYIITGNDNAYYCADRDMVLICEKLSGVNDNGLQTRCYYEETYKTCKTGWEEIKIGQEIVNQEIPSGKKYLCDQIKCEEI